MPSTSMRSLALALAMLVSAAPAYNAPSRKKLVIGPENARALQQLANYPDLEVLTISCLENLKALPDSIGSLAHLRELVIDNGNGCAMNPVLPESLGNLHALERLVLYGAQDPRPPGSQPHLRHPFPRSLSQLKNLVYLDLGRNGLDEIPAFVRGLPKLKELRFAWNMKLKEVPAFLAGMHELAFLDLGSDGLADLPDFLNTMTNLARIRLGENCRITASAARKNALKSRFPRIAFDFANEYDCPSK
ncbi:MAG: hypothetical protein WCE75_13830 [Terracidiphilus sp.]